MKKSTVKVIVLVGITLILGLGIGYYFGYDHGWEKSVTNQITSFEECAAAGYPIMESYPERCMTPDGKTFVKEIDDNQGVCTMDAKLCPDGSSVGRVPPACEFAPCP